MATNLPIEVIFTPGQPLATWNLAGNDDTTIQANVGDTLTFTFTSTVDSNETMSDGIVFSGPRKHTCHGSPFHKNQLPIKDTQSVDVQNTGTWGFSIAFTTTTPDGVSAFYFLPDPELEVGSNV